MGNGEHRFRGMPNVSLRCDREEDKKRSRIATFGNLFNLLISSECRSQAALFTLAVARRTQRRGARTAGSSGADKGSFHGQLKCAICHRLNEFLGLERRRKHFGGTQSPPIIQFRISLRFRSASDNVITGAPCQSTSRRRFINAITTQRTRILLHSARPTTQSDVLQATFSRFVRFRCEDVTRRCVPTKRFVRSQQQHPNDFRLGLALRKRAMHKSSDPSDATQRFLMIIGGRQFKLLIIRNDTSTPAEAAHCWDSRKRIGKPSAK